jgi:hypothetical protein
MWFVDFARDNHPHNIYLINILEKVQIEAMRMISGGTKLTPLKELYKETGLLKLKDRWENLLFLVLHILKAVRNQS